ncbi:hypothetical protein [Micromonospora endolithica]|uniref:DUF4352 domain-containing protein n=1 Tax=Micromonospora endolithica TaxID=230091 RepID=A0A3A9ZNA3_9ACTN|nr:hypothetical protein [Micromonospora endolithica]RKN49384.1 hypothetical protein D7223_07770 [Micromonospora endolithica]TWJ23574.1 hypothetical protein JD76_03713 [Micromonospora endolithica]
MPASTRHHRVMAVFVNCLGVLAALPALPAAAPDAATAERRPVTHAAAPSAEPGRPSAPPALPTPTRDAVPPPKPAVTVAVASEGTPAPRYRIQVRNSGSAPVSTTVRQELPPGSSATTITDGGRTTRTAGTDEVTWRLRLPARSTTTLATTLTTATPDQPHTAPACAFDGAGNRPYDCATATWNAAPAAVERAPQTPVWRRPAVLLAGLGGVVVLALGGIWLFRRRRRPTAAALAHDGPGTVYPRPAVPEVTRRRRRPSTWLLVPAAALVLAGTVGTATWTATRRVAAVDTDSQPTTGAWIGRGVAGGVGEPLRESAFEFTVYRVTCQPGQDARRCEATVGVRNVSPERQSWHGRLQRAYLPDGNFVSTDEQATRSANQGRDVFAEPMAAGSRMVLPLVFTVHGEQPPQQLELRSGVFSAGVRVDVP